MAEPWFLEQLEDMTGRVAIVTGGAAGIGLENTIYLAAKGCKVYVASRNAEKSQKGIQEAQTRLDGKGGEILFHMLELSSMAAASDSAAKFLEREQRLDIVIANAGVSMMTQDELSPEGWERVTFILPLVDLVKHTAQQHGEARIVNVSSNATRSATGIDYDALHTVVPNDGKSIKDIPKAFTRYANSKLANVYFTQALDRHIRESGVDNVYVNSCHPGVSGNTGLGGTYTGVFPAVLESVVRYVMGLPFLGNSLEDSAKTQTYLAAAKEVREREVHGEFWVPHFKGFSKVYNSCGLDTTPPPNKDEDAAQKLWEETQKAVQAARQQS